MNMSVKIDIETASALWKDGSSMGVIATKYGVSRQVVAGIMYRNRELFPKRSAEVLAISKATKAPRSLKEPAGVKSSKYVHTRNIHKARMEAARREAEEFESGASPFLQIHAGDSDRIATAKTLIDLGPHDCKWPLNDGGPFLFCAAPKFGGSRSYCAHHMLRGMPKGAA